MDSVAQILREKNLKATPQRMAIYSALAASHSHPTAEALYTAVREIYPSISLATVYKTLASLKNAGLIQEINTDSQTSHYDAQINFHPHTICLCCGEVADFHTDKFLEELKSELYESTGFSSTSEQLNFYGICKKCRNAAEA